MIATPPPQSPVNGETTSRALPSAAALNDPTTTQSDESDISVSDLDSDLELDELVPAYLKIKGKLFEIDPQLVDASTRKPPKGAKSKKSAPVPAQSPAVRKLLSQLQQLTSDALFDQDRAEAQWPAKRNQIAQSQAEKRQRNDSQPSGAQAQDTDANLDLPVSADMEATPAPAASPSEHEGEEDADLLGGMFSAVPDPTPASEGTSNGESASGITLRDFGKMSGMSPRKVLEEAVRSRLVIQQHFQH